jgi:hypothetical protein
VDRATIRAAGTGAQTAGRTRSTIVRRRIAASCFLAAALGLMTSAPAVAHPDNDKTLHFVLTCDDGHVWDAAFNGGPSAFHLDGERLFIWKQISYVTPDGQSGTIGHGINGFSGGPTVTCTYTGAVSGNAYTVVGFYPPNG